MVIWITGISGAGKSTVCEAIIQMAKPYVPEMVWLDGDVVREIFGDNLGHTEPDRMRQIQRIQRLAKELDAQGMVVLVAALYAHPDLLSWNRENFESYAEIYRDAPLELVRKRDPKGLYAKVQTGEVEHVVGIDIPWHAPENSTLTVQMTDSESPDSIARRIVEVTPVLSKRILAPASENV